MIFQKINISIWYFLFLIFNYIIQKIHYTLFETFIFSFNFNFNSYKFYKYTKPSCTIGYFSLSLNYLKIKKDFILPVNDNTNCLSVSVVFIILCTLCKSFCIEDTGRCVKDRIKEHLDSIDKFIKYKIPTVFLGHWLQRYFKG